MQLPLATDLLNSIYALIELKILLTFNTYI